MWLAGVDRLDRDKEGERNAPKRESAAMLVGLQGTATISPWSSGFAAIEECRIEPVVERDALQVVRGPMVVVGITSIA
jgi:hypothetical protein